MKQTMRAIFCIIGLVVIWLWVVISVCRPEPRQVSYYTPDFVESYTTGSFDQLQISKIYYLDPGDTPDRISKEDFQECGRYFVLLELKKESGVDTDIYTAVFQETDPSS